MEMLDNHLEGRFRIKFVLGDHSGTILHNLNLVFMGICARGHGEHGPFPDITGSEGVSCHSCYGYVSRTDTRSRLLLPDPPAFPALFQRFTHSFDVAENPGGFLLQYIPGRQLRRLPLARRLVH
jgi:hypothetical protein